MSQQTKYLVFAGVLAGVPLAMLPDRGASAADECLSAPNHQLSTTGHWNYRIDRTNHRKCWYVKSAGRKVRSVAAKPHRVRVTQPTPEAAAEPPAIAWRVEQPVVPIRSAVLAVQGAQHTDPPIDQQTVRPKIRNDIISARWPDPVQANGRTAGAAALTGSAGADSTAGSRGDGLLKEQGQSSVEAASTEQEAASAIDSISTIALLAGVLAGAGAVGGMTFRHFGLRQRRRPDVAARAYAVCSASPREESILPILARASAAAIPAKARHVGERAEAAVPAVVSRRRRTGA
jgi:hypothetical protein